MGDSKKTGIIFWRAVPCSIQSLPVRECSRNPSVSVYSQVLLWEAKFSSSAFFFKILSTYLPISWWVIYQCACPHYIECSAVFAQKQHDPNASPSLFTWSYPKWLIFCFPGWKKSSKGNILLMCKPGKTENSRSTKGIKIEVFKNCFEQ